MKKSYTEGDMTRARIDEYTCDFKGCKQMFIDRNGEKVGDKAMPPEWGHVQLAQNKPVPRSKKRVYRSNRDAHLCPKHSDQVLALIRHVETVE